MKKRHHHKMKESMHHKKHMGGMMDHDMMMHKKSMMDNDMMMSDMDMMKRSIHRDRMMGEEHYAGYDPRRMQEMRDAGMIQEDHRALANLPQQPIMKYYEGGYHYMPEGLDDTIRGIDNQIGADDAMARKMLHPHKY